MERVKRKIAEKAKGNIDFLTALEAMLPLESDITITDKQTKDSFDVEIKVTKIMLDKKSYVALLVRKIKPHCITGETT